MKLFVVADDDGNFDDISLRIVAQSVAQARLKYKRLHGKLKASNIALVSIQVVGDEITALTNLYRWSMRDKECELKNSIYIVADTNCRALSFVLMVMFPNDMNKGDYFKLEKMQCKVI